MYYDYAMWKRLKLSNALVVIVGLVTLGSGILNLYSVIGPNLPERHALLRELFPLEFLHLTRFVTLLIGFALVLSSINIFKRKKRAHQVVSLLAFASVISHLVKGIDYEEALLSLFLLILLYPARRSFVVKSNMPDIRSALLRLEITAVIVFGYGVAGFWFLDEREFGINFTIGDAITRTFHYLSLTADPDIVPHTHYAVWFLDSLYLVTVTALAYSAYSLYRPVIYQYRTLPHERELAGSIVKAHGRSSLDYFKLWPDKSYYFSPSRNSLIAYCFGNNAALALADPVGPEAEIEHLILAFTTFCKENDWAVGFYQTLPDFIPLYRKLGFKKMKIGDEAIVDLQQFNLDGKSKKKIRHYVNQLDKSGITIDYQEPPISDDLLIKVREVSEEWLELPGRRERSFTLGQFEPEYIRSTPVFSALNREGQVLAFVNIVPSYYPGEATIDLMRHRKDAPDGMMDFLFVKLFQFNKEKGFSRFNLGMSPMSGFEEREKASPEERAVHFFFERLNFLFSYRGLKQYKAKFATSWEPRYAVYRTVLELPQLILALGRVSEL
jgi:phosphatidylglycerol lysyltransferase